MQTSTKSNLDWPVVAVPVKLNGKPTAYFNIVRKDTGFVLGNCTSKYKIKQNSEFIKETLELAEANGFKVIAHRIGTVDKNGKQVFLQFDTGEYNVGGDNLSESVTVVHHHDGRVVTNQSFCSYVMQNGSSFNLGMKAAKDIGGVMCLKCAEDIVNDLLSMYSASIERVDVNELVEFLTNPNNKTVSKRMQAIQNNLKKSISDIKPANAWDVFKGIIEYSESVKSSKDRKASMFVGSSARMVEIAFTYLSTRSRGK